MKSSIVLSLDTRARKKDSTFPVVMRVTHFGKSAPIPTGFSLLEKDWDANKRVIKSSYKGTDSVTRLNNMLQKKKSDALDVITKLEEKKALATLSVYELRELIVGKSKQQLFIKYGESLIQELLQANRIGNARSYKSSLSVLKTYCLGKDISFQEMNFNFLKTFEKKHLAKGNSPNGLAAYMRTYRAIFNLAIKSGIIDKELYPFESYQIKTIKTRKRAIGIESIKKIMNLELERDSHLFHTRNFFLASFYMRGMPFADLAQLKLSNIIDGRIYYQRKKTDKPYNIKITSEIAEIVNIYITDKSKDDFIFPIIKREEISEQYKDIEWARSRYNKRLQEIANLCGIEENITSYVSRHSFATRAKNLGVPIATISDMLGHADTKTTEIYLDSLQSDLMDEAHEKIIR